jgi:GT2 family glycosyltransferase
VGSADEVDILTLFHNSRDRVGPYLDCLARIPRSIRFTVHLLDNGSTDGTADLLGQQIGSLGFPVRFHRSARNHGFAGGMNLLFRQAESDFLFVLNSDAHPEADCLERLIERMTLDPHIGICEARQVPDEHPKMVDSTTGETTWCSGAAALIRREAFEEVGGFDDRLFFMYCEDIDLGWKMWLHGWKCVYVPAALVEHRVGGSRSQIEGASSRRLREHYFSFRNSLFIYHRFRRPGESRLLWNFLLKRFASRRYSFRSKALFAIAFVDHIRYIPYLLRTRSAWGDKGHPWIRLEETSLAE